MRNEKKRKIILELMKQTHKTKYSLAKAANASNPWTIQYLQQLEQKKITKNLTIINQEELINEYLKTRKKRKIIEAHLTNPEQTLKKIKTKYALTTYAAENKTTHLLFPSRYDIYIKNKEEWEKIIKQEGLLGRGNTKLIIDEEEATNNPRIINKIKIVSEELLMIDLKAEGGVCEQAYENIKNVRQNRNR